MRPGQSVGVVCDQYGYPSIEAHQTLPGEIMGTVYENGRTVYVVRVDRHNGWIVTRVEDETLLFPTLH